MKTRLRHRECIIAWWFGALLPLLTVFSARGEVILGPTTSLSVRSTDNHHPAIAASADGSVTFVAWDGEVQGSRRILVRESYQGMWLPELLIDDRPGAENTRPAIDVADDGTPHLAWLARENGRVLPRYATRIAGRWIQMPISNEIGTGDCDYVTLKVDPEGRPWIAWQVGQGSVYEIFCSSPDEEGFFETQPLTPGATSHNLFPEIFFDPQPVVAWYSDRDEQTFLMGKRFDTESKDWEPLQLENLESLPTEPVPQLVSRSSGPLAALWYERAITRTGEISGTDRILMGEQGPETRGGGVVIDEQPESNNRLVAGAALPGSIVAVWCSDSPHGDTRIVLGHGGTATQMENAIVSDGMTRQPSNPKVSAIGSGAGVVWESNAPSGGDGHIYFRTADLR